MTSQSHSQTGARKWVGLCITRSEIDSLPLLLAQPLVRQETVRYVIQLIVNSSVYLVNVKDGLVCKGGGPKWFIAEASSS